MPIDLARLPTPTQPLPRLSRHLGVDVYVKRDDLTGFGVSGNKVRKLTYLLEEALRFGATTVLTTGGLQSNHCRATAIAARQLGMRPVLFLRGELPEVPNGNLLLDKLVDAEIHLLTPEAYREDRDRIMARHAQRLRDAGEVPYVIPEGGSNPLGSKAYVDAVDELVNDYDHTFVAVGSGGTLAGLAMSTLKGRLHGIAVCDDRPTFEQKVRDISHASNQDLKADWEVLETYRGPAYGVATPPVWKDIQLVAKLEGLLLDPCYTGKAMHGLCEEARAGRISGSVLFWHTGGAFALFGRGAELS